MSPDPRLPGTTVRGAALAARAARLYAEMKSFQEIADILGYASKSSAYEAVMRHAARTKPNAPEAAVGRLMEVDHLDYLRSQLAEQVQQGDQGAIKEARMISERKAKLQGWDLNESRVAGALEAGAVANLMASSQLHAGIIAAMGKIGMPLEMQDRLIAAINEWLAEQQQEPEQEEPVSSELVIITGEVGDR